jgi:ribosomal protein L3
MGGSRKQFTTHNDTNTKKHPGQMGGSRKQFTTHNDTNTKKHPGQMGGSRKTKNHAEIMHETCVACHREGRKDKVEIRDVRKETFKGKGATMRKRLVGKCEHGHKWFRFAKST